MRNARRDQVFDQCIRRRPVFHAASGPVHSTSTAAHAGHRHWRRCDTARVTMNTLSVIVIHTSTWNVGQIRYNVECSLGIILIIFFKVLIHRRRIL